jgi:phosphoribosylformylglycinamidine synthase
MDLKQPGDLICLVGSFKPAFGGSHFNLVCPERQVEEGLPLCEDTNPQVYQAVHQAMSRGWISACHDLSEGGLAVASAEMALAGRLGLTLNLDSADLNRELFGETAGCLLVEIDPAHRAEFIDSLEGLPKRWVGRVESTPYYRVENQTKRVVELSLNDILQAWKGATNPEVKP